MLAAEARSIPDQNQNQNQNQNKARDEIKIERQSEPERRHGLAVDSRSTKTLPNDKLRRDPRTTSLPRARDEPNHIRLSQGEFQKGLEKRSMEKQRRQSAHPRRRIEEDQDVLIGPFHARNQQEIELKKNEFLEKSKNTNREEIKRWALEQVESRNVDDDLLGVQSDHHQAIINSFDQSSNLSNSVHSNDQSNDFKLKGRQLDQDEDLLDSIRREEQLQEEDLQEDESYSNWLKRQTQAEQTCFVGNDQLSCYPNSGTEVVQDRWSKFIWNKNYPRFAQIGFVDVYLFRQDQDSIQTSWTSLNNNEGRLSFSPTDSYWQGRPRADNIEAGQNITWPFYFVVTYAGAGLSGTTDRQSTWSAIQTAVPVAVASSRSAASVSSSLSAASASIAATATSTLTGAAASSASASDASVSSSIVASLSRSLVSELQASGLTGTETLQGTLTTTLSDGQVVTATATGQANGSLSDSSNDDGGGGLPKYAIALIVVFGFLALVAALVGIYFLMAAMRKRRNRNDSTMGSTSPMMRDGIPSSIAPSLDAGTAGGVAGAGLLGTNRSIRSNEDDQLFTSDEATRMADAFRAALRKPEFASPFGSNNQSGDDDDGNNGDREDDSPGTNEGSKGNELLRSELASEGYDLRPVQNRGRAELHGED